VGEESILSNEKRGKKTRSKKGKNEIETERKAKSATKESTDYSYKKKRMSQ